VISPKFGGRIQNARYRVVLQNTVSLGFAKDVFRVRHLEEKRVCINEVKPENIACVWVNGVQNYEFCALLSFFT
jgi:hypothetical protein